MNYSRLLPSLGIATLYTSSMTVLFAGHVIVNICSVVVMRVDLIIQLLSGLVEVTVHV